MPPSSDLDQFNIATSSRESPSNQITSIMPRKHTQSKLENIPLELRQQMYAYLFSDEEDNLTVTIAATPDKGPTKFHASVFPVIHSLLLTSKQLAFEARYYFFHHHRFRLVDYYRSPLTLLEGFKREIGLKNLALVRKLAVPQFSIGLFGNVDCLVGLGNMRCVAIMLATFPALTHLDLGVSLAECLPWSHPIFRISDGGLGGLERWDWTGEDVGVPLRGCFEELGRFMGLEIVEVGVYWSDLLNEELLPEDTREVFSALEADYKERFLVVLQQWTKAKTVKSKGPLLGFEQGTNSHGAVVMPKELS